jgi:hypothetical protein
MNYIYKFFIKNEKNEKLPNDDKYNIRDFMNISVNTTNMNETNGQKKEIYVMVDFIEGKLDDTNKQQVKCMFYDNHLGNELDHLLFDTGNPEKWNITANRKLFSIKSLNATKNASSENIENENNIPNNNIYNNEKQNKNKERNIQHVSDDENIIKDLNILLNDDFKDIIKKENNENKIKLINEYEKLLKEINESKFNENKIENIFKFLNIPENNKKYFQFFDLLKDFYNEYMKKNDHTVSTKIRDKFVLLQSNLLGQIKIININLKKLTTEKYKDDKKINKLEYENKISMILEKLADIFITIGIKTGQNSKGGNGYPKVKKTKNEKE